MTKRGYIEYRRGRAAFKAGLAFTLTASHEWKIGFLAAKNGW